MRILILGGTGAIGAFLTQILSENKENDIYITSRMYYKSIDNMHYIQGNARDSRFISKLLCEKYDVIVDFMSYTSSEFSEIFSLLLNSAKQYIFLSSSRVYADMGMERIKEDSPRLLDICSNREYLNTDEYALAKAREENMLFTSMRKNWTIIRPYITYNDERLQLGTYEKEAWLYRSLSGKRIVFPQDIADKYTTMTYGGDVAKIIALLMGNEKAYGEVFNVATEQFIKWKEVLGLYMEVIGEKTGAIPDVCMPMNSSFIGDIFNNKYQVCYDRLFNRCFCNEKVNKVLGYDIQYTDVYSGLKKCLIEFIDNRRNYRNISWKSEAYLDRMSGDKTPIGQIQTIKYKMTYIALRYMGISI